MILHWSLPLVKRLLPPHLAARLKERASIDPSLDFDAYPSNTLRFYDADEGPVIAEVPIKDGSIRVARKRLRALCADGVDIKYGHTLQTIQVEKDHNKVSAMFSNGVKATGTRHIGCDGAKSPVRNYLFGEGKASITPLDLAYWSVVAGYPNAEQALHVRSAHPVFSIAVGSGITSFIATYGVPDPERPETWRFHVALSWRRDKNFDVRSLPNTERHDILREKAKRLCEPFRTAILALSDDKIIPYDDIGYWVAEPRDTHGGLVTIAGEAAHPMTHHRGQGCNNAVQDAYDLAEAMKAIEVGAEQQRLVQECSDESAKRGAAETKLSLENAYALLDRDVFYKSPIFRYSLSARH